MRFRILIVDDHKLVREGFRLILDNDPSVEVVGDTDNGRSAVSMIQELRPHVVLIDLAMPEMNGIEAIRQIKADAPEVKTLALTMHSSRQFVTSALRAGASGYLLKDSAATELIDAIKAVAGGAVYLSSKVMSVIADDYRHRRTDSPSATQVLLSARERQVLQLVAEGKNTKEVAFVLDVSIKTVESHRAHIMKKLKTHSLADMIKYAIREGITSLE